MLASIAAKSAGPGATSCRRHRPSVAPKARNRPLTAGESSMLEMILHARTSNAIPVASDEIYVTQACRLLAPLGHPRIAARLADAGLILVACHASYDLLGDVIYRGEVSVTPAGRQALHTGRLALA